MYPLLYSFFPLQPHCYRMTDYQLDPAVKLICLGLGCRTLKDHIRYLFGNAYLTEFSEIALFSFFCYELNGPLN